MANRDHIVITAEELKNSRNEGELIALINKKFAEPTGPVEKKQNVMAVSDDLMSRIKSLQDLYRVNGQLMPIDMLIDQALDAWIRENTDSGR